MSFLLPPSLPAKGSGKKKTALDKGFKGWGAENGRCCLFQERLEKKGQRFGEGRSIAVHVIRPVGPLPGSL